jgi:hypothetical protein
MSDPNWSLWNTDARVSRLGGVDGVFIPPVVDAGEAGEELNRWEPMVCNFIHRSLRNLLAMLNSMEEFCSFSRSSTQRATGNLCNFDQARIRALVS